MNARTRRAVELAAAAFGLVRHKGAVVSNGENVATILWANGTAGLSGRLYTTGLRVTLEIWTKERVLAVSRITGAPDCQVEEFSRGDWEKKLLALAAPPVH